MWDPVEYLKTQHTKQLLNLRDAIYRVNSGAQQEYWSRPTDDHDMVYNLDECPGYRLVSLAQVKAELATREHVPNKAEAKAIRQQKAKAKKNR